MLLSIEELKTCVRAPLVEAMTLAVVNFSFSQDYTATERRSSIGVTKSRARCMPSLTQFMGRANGVLMDGATSETTRVAYCLEKRMTHFTHTVRFQPPNPRR